MEFAAGGCFFALIETCGVPVGVGLMFRAPLTRRPLRVQFVYAPVAPDSQR